MTLSFAILQVYEVLSRSADASQSLNVVARVAAPAFPKDKLESEVSEPLELSFNRHRLPVGCYDPVYRFAYQHTYTASVWLGNRYQSGRARLRDLGEGTRYL